MPSYLVTWTIQVDAESPEDAALQALGIQQDPESIATVFKVMDEESEEIQIIDAYENTEAQRR